MAVDNPRTSATAIAWRWWALAISVAAADQLTKLAVSTLMYYGQSIPLTGFFNLVHVWNTGAAFSFLADAGGWQRYFFIVITLGVSIVLIFMLCRPRPRAEALGYSLVLGGALGNGFDRVVRGYVVDSLDFYWRSWHWPAFNIADCGIVLGVFCLLWTAYRTPG
ncbi:signal peptidase II [Syntrophotalea acetylenivorans]|uniref:Lipoprotein signal peptidase n=2 Tax=Syntrophotalea acetylenivorans TaxID=1842532 RepID=A0A1L3GMJ9_9BACT|nr:signal peptidase II [Syntrophotalea acetylenivorans]APG27154.1 signal peptidase II [Syntrophotalea acetylenivorans]